MKPRGRERIVSFDLIRTVAALAVFTYHFSLASGSGVFPVSFLSLKDGLGFVSVSIFFMLSGASLYYSYADRIDFKDPKGLRSYFVKRASAIYPPFYLVFFTLYILRALKYKSFFYLGKKLVFLLSLAGLDGYFSYETETYYLVGEWFLGAVIILYVLFPLIVSLMRRNAAALYAAVVMLYLLTINRRMLSPAEDANIFSCLVSFVTGMLFIHAQRNEKVKGENTRSGIDTPGTHILAAASLLLIIMVCMADLTFGLNRSLTGHLYAAGLFVFLYIEGRWLCKNSRFLALFFRHFSEASYVFFLIHHVILVKICRHVNTGKDVLWSFLWYIIILLAVYWISRIFAAGQKTLIAFMKRT